MADAKTVKIKLDIDAEEAIKTSQKLKQQLNEMFTDDGNLSNSMNGLIQQMQVLTQHVDSVTANLGSMGELLKSVSNGTSAGVNAQALQTQNVQYQEQLRLLTQMNTQMQLLINQESQQRVASRNSGSGTGERISDIEALRARLGELNAEYAHLEELSQECANQMNDLGQEGQAAMAAWAAEVSNAGPELEDFNDIVENIKRQFADSGMPMSDATENVLRNWAAVANQMTKVSDESTKIGNVLNSQVVPAGNRVLTTFSRMGGAATNALNALSRGLRRTGTFLSSLSRAASRLRSLFNGLFRLITSVGRGAINVFKQLVTHTNNVNKAAQKAHGNFGNLFKTVLATVLGIKGLSATISSIKNIGVEGLKSLSNSFEDIKNQLDSVDMAWTNFKASLVSIIQPIYSAIQPALTQLVNWLTNIMTTVAKFVAAFTGQDFIYKGVAKSAKETGKNAKKATEEVEELVKQLQGFDELNNLTSQKEKEAADTSPGEGMFDNVEWKKEPIPDWIKDWVEKIKEIFRQLFEPLKKAWERMGTWVMSSWKFALKEVWNLVKSIGKSFLKAWNLGTVQKIFEDILFVVGAIGRGIGVIALKFREVWDEDERGVRFFEAIFKLVQKFTEQVKLLAADTLNWLARLEFEPLFDSLIQLLEDLQEPIETIARVARKFIVEVVYKYIKWLIEKGLPKLLDIVDRFIKKVDWGKFEENITKIFGPLEHAMEEISDGVLDFIDQMAQKLADFINSDDFKAFTDKIAKFLNNINSEDILDGLNYVKDTISGFFKQLKEDIEKVWNSEPVQKFITWLKGKDGDPETLGRNIAKVVEAIGGFMILSSVAGVFGPFVTLLGQSLGLIGKISGGISGLASTAAVAEGIEGAATGAGTSFGTQFFAGFMAAWAGLDIGVWFGEKFSLLFGDEEMAAMYAQYDGLTGKIQLLYDTIKSVVDLWDIWDEKINDWITGGEEVQVAVQNISREIREGEIPAEKDLQEQLEATGARVGVVRDRQEELTQKVFDAHPQLRALADSVKDAGIAMEDLDGITQVAAGLEYFRDSGNDAAATSEYLAQQFGFVDEQAEWFFAMLAEGNQAYVDAANNYEAYVSTMTTETENFVTATNTAINDGLPSPEDMSQKGQDIATGLNNGIETGSKQTESTTKTWGQTIIDTFKDIFNIHSPSKVMEDIGVNIVQGFIDGLKNTVSTVFATLSNFGNQFINAFVNIRSRVLDVFKSMAVSIAGILKNVLSSISNAVNSAISSMQYLKNLGNNSVVKRISINVPKLAQGAVIPPNKEFMAVLGDQKSGTNIESPLSTMVEAFNQAGGNRSEQEISLLTEQNQLLRQLLDKEWSISSSRMLSAMQRQAVVYTKQTGKPAF